MSDLWFDPARWSWLPGTVVGCSCGVWGAVAGTLAPRGKARTLVLGLGSLLFGLSVVLLAAGLTALAMGQPYGVWYGLGLGGLVGTFVIPPVLPIIRQRYREGEERRMQAADL